MGTSGEPEREPEEGGTANRPERRGTESPEAVQRSRDWREGERAEGGKIDLITCSKRILIYI